jgi:ribosomal-protein-alanine N-acetyltransferase
VNGLQLATINRADLEPILAIEQHSFQWPWGRISFEGELNSQNTCNYVVKSAEGDTCGQVIAYAFLRLAADELHILKIAVRPAWRGQGIATWLLERCFIISAGQGAKSAHLEVRPSNIPAVEFYQKLGFQVIGRRPKYYADSKEDAVLMMKSLTRINREMPKMHKNNF